MKSSDLNSICTTEKQQHINEFADYCCNKLGIDRPDLTLKGTNDTNALGYTDMTDGSVTIVVADRHQMDIMRTLAHELVHVKQMKSYEPDGTTGSADENEANALAGVLMREWGQNNPDLYTEGKNMREDSSTVSNYNPDGKTYKGKRMPSLDDDDLNNMAQDIDSFDDNEFAYDHDMDKSIDDDNRNKKMADILDGLTPKEQKVMKMRFVDDMTLREIGKVFNVGGERIRQIEQKALRKLRHPTRLDQLAPYVEARFSMKKPKPSAQDRFNKRLKDKHGIDLDANLKFYQDMQKKFQKSMDTKKADENFGEPSADAKDRAAAAQQKNIDDKYVKTVASNSTAGIYKNTSEQVDESKTARMMALITALGATYGLEDEARAFADQIKQNIHNAQTAEPNPGRPDPVTPGNMMPGSDGVMRPQLTKEQRLREIKKRQMMIRQKIQEISEAKKDACYNKVKSRYKVWPSAYASGALVKCRKVGAKNWGNKSKK